MQDLKGKAAPEFLDNVTLLGLTQGNVPQIKEIDAALHRLSGAGVEGVPAIIPPSKFFKLLSERKFPVATFLRRPEDINYIEEPDIFHEVFGHCPMLTNSDFADFIQGFGQKAVELGKGYSWHLFRLFWFTVEFGMVKTPEGLRAYGAGIVSSPSEAAHACGPDAEVLDFDLLDILRTSYRIDIVQPVYFAVTGFAQLAACLDQDFAALINEARRLGDHPKRYTPAA
jgi:phenylalanine-4-hydroxylase